MGFLFAYLIGVAVTLLIAVVVSTVRGRKGLSTASPFSATASALMWPLGVTGVLAMFYGAAASKVFAVVIGDR